MDLLSLNCQGYGRLDTVNEIRRLVVTHRPMVVFSSEMKLSEARGRNLRYRLGFDHAFAVKCDGRSGGLCLLWNSDSSVSLKSFSNSHIEEKRGDSLASMENRCVQDG
jgi:hypothetical protein